MVKYSEIFILLITATVITTVTFGCRPDKLPAYKDPDLSPEERTEDLLGRMTVEEKLGQLLCPLGWPMYEKTAYGDSTSVEISDEYRRFIKEMHGGMLWATFRADPWTKRTIENGLTPTLSAQAYNALQRYAIDSTKLGIPIILAEEAPHGHMAIGTTVFPTGLGLAATWDTGLLEEIGSVIAEELRVQGANIGYGPVVDLAREPRWSRVEETFGEDVFLTSKLSAAMIRGSSPKYNGWDNGVVSTLKHFVSYGIPEGGHNGNPAYVGMRDLVENFLPPFKSAIDAGALSVMTSYNSIDGIPSTANPDLIRKILKNKWGFEGFVVSDLVSIDGLCSDHRIAPDNVIAGKMALSAGVDVDLGANCYYQLKDAVESGEISMKVIDDAVSRVLRLKFEFGLFDKPYIDATLATVTVGSKKNALIARRAACEGVVLLENNGVLPLRKDMKIAVIGPNADNMYNQLGDYTAPQTREKIKTVLDGIRNKIGSENVCYVRGCAVRDTLNDNIKEAVSAASKADVAVVVVGGSSARDFKTVYQETGAAIADDNILSDMEAGEGFDRAGLALLGHQSKLLSSIKATGTPMIVVYIEGRPLDKRWASLNADALITQFYPGQEGGDGLADVLFGDFNPAGRLPISVPYDVGQLPVYYNRKFPAGHDYVELPSNPLYPFGYGLSYTSFEYSGLFLENLGENKVKVSFDIRNTGKYDGEEVVQIYVTDTYASTVRPQIQLREFDRIFVRKGDIIHAEFILNEEAFSLCNSHMETLVENGEFIVSVGSSSQDIRLEGKIVL